MRIFVQFKSVCLAGLLLGVIGVRAADTEPPAIQNIAPLPGSTVAAVTAISVGFSEAVLGVHAEDLLINGEPALDLEVFGNTYTFFCSAPLPGFVSIYFDSDHGITDASGNAFDESVPVAAWSYSVSDATPPAVIRLSPPNNAVVRGLLEVEVLFTETVSGVDAGDLRIDGVAATNVIGVGPGPYRFSFHAPPAGTVTFSWAADSGIRDAFDNAFPGGNWSVTLDPAAPVTVAITEFLTANESSSGLRDEQNELHDWIELHNYGAAPVNLTGWSLTNDRDKPRQWLLPAISLNPGQYLVVFASGKDRVAPRLHANFQLSGTGEYLALSSADEPAGAFSEFDYPEQRVDYSYGFDATGALRYFAAPTPGAPNGASGVTDVTQPVHFSVERGFFNAPFNLVLATLTPGAAIRFTLDGSLPTVNAGNAYAGPIVVSNTVAIRAAAFASNALPSVARTHTYIFPEQVLRQPNNPPGFPTAWITQSGSKIIPADYGMDGRIVNNPAYTNLVRQGLVSIPTLSIVMKMSDLFGQANGIYSNPRGTGIAWERPASAEFIFTDGSDALQLDAGYRIQGGTSREEDKTHKHSQRLLFRGAHGAGRLKTRLFKDSPVESFDTLVVDAGLNLVWTHRSDATQRRQAQYVRDQFVSDLQNAMGWPAFHGRFFHLYLNGLYWGLHGIHERPEEDFAASYFGGSENDWDIIKHTTAFEVLSGDVTAWNAMRGLANAGLASDSQYQQIQQYLDVPSLIDYMILNIYTGNTDWPHHNWYVGRRRAPAGTFKFFNWDAEHVLKDAAYNNSTVAQLNTPAEFYDQLRRHNAEFRLRFADHVHQHFFNDGICTSNQAMARYLARIREIDPAIVLESARWGDNASNTNRPGMAYERNIEWQAELTRLTNTWFPQRSTVVLNQFRGLGLYPSVAAPAFNQQGGRVARGFSLSMSAPAGTIYFTTNGIDPRVYLAGTPAPDALVYSNAVPLARTVTVKARALAGTNWSALNEAQFMVAELTLPLRITEIMYNPPGGDAFEFIELRNVGDTPLDVSGFTFTGITFAFPEGSVLAPGAAIVLAADVDPAAFAQRYPGVAVFGFYADRLANGGERISIKRGGETMTSVTYDDENDWPAAADGRGQSLEIIDARANPNDPANWRASAAANGSPGNANAPPALAPVVISEVMAINTGSVSNAGRFPEWIELHNSGPTNIDLGGWSLSDDDNPRSYVFPVNTILAPGGYLVIWCDFQTGLTQELHAAMSLRDGGESIFLYDRATNRVAGITYGLQIADHTVGRVGLDWELCLPTPGAANAPAALASASHLAINEWLANAVPGGADWVELFNSSASAPVSLRDIYLGSSNALFQLRYLSFLPPRGHVQLLADELPGITHLGFRLSSGGADITLYDNAGALLDQVVYGAQAEGVSQGRLPDGAETIQNFPGTPSPGAANYILSYSGPVLNEIMARNLDAVRMSNGLAADWVELHNPNPNTFDLSGMRLSIDLAQSNQWIFPPGSTIAANGYLLVWCTSERPASTIFGPELNTGQGIDTQSGAAYLFGADGRIVDSIELGFQPANQSVGRTAGGWNLLASPTPGAANSDSATLGSPAAIRINEWMPAGIDGDWFELYNPGAAPVALSGLFLTDNPSIFGITNHIIAPLSFIEPGGWVRFFADSEPALGRDHVNFRLDDFGETIRLYDSNLQLIDAIDFGLSQFGVSEGRLPDGAARIVKFPISPTPASANYQPLRRVIVNEIMVNPPANTEQAIELYNPTAQALDISHWWLSDSGSAPQKFLIPSGTIVPAGGFHVFYAAQFSSTNSLPFALRSSAGEVWLSEGDAAGNLSGARVKVAYGPLPFARSYGRTPCTGSSFVALIRPTFGIDAPASVEQFRLGTGAVNSPPGPIEDQDDPPSAPYISDEPLPRIVPAGSTVLLQVGACGGAPLAWQWFFNNTLLPQATNAVLQITNIQPADVGDYFAIVTNSLGGATSKVARIALGDLPVITAHPQSWRTNGGSSASFAVEANGPALSYQWRFNAIPIAGATNPVLTLTTITFSDAGHYSVIVSNLVGVIASQAVALTVTPSLQITLHPQGRSVLPGSNVLFSTSANGSGALRYQWFHNNNPIANVTSASFTVTDAQLANHGEYFVEITDDNGAVRSQSAFLIVRVPPIITQQPASLTVVEGDTVTLSVGVTGMPPLGFRWRRNGITVGTRVDDPTITLTNVQLAQAGFYNVTITNVANTFPGVTSSNATLTVLMRPLLAQPRLLGGEFEVFMRASTGRVHVIERSSDLLNWSEFRTFNTGTNSETRIFDPSPGSNGFYRAYVVP